MILKKCIFLILFFSFFLSACQLDDAIGRQCGMGRVAVSYSDLSAQGYLVADPSGKILSRIPTDNMKFSTNFRFSQVGQSILAGGSQLDFSETGWYTIDVVSGKWMKFYVPPIQYGQPGIWLLSPDNRKITLSISKSDNFIHFYVMNSDKTDLLDLTGQSQNYEGPDDWSKDGKYILFDSLLPSGAKDTLNIVNSDGTARRVLYSTENIPLYARWSPDNNYIVAQEGYSAPTLFLLDFNTLAKLALPEIPQNSYSPAWSPDGKCIAFLHGNGVYIYHLETQQVVELKNLERGNGYQWLDWSRR